jgi:hypothetical protein
MLSDLQFWRVAGGEEQEVEVLSGGMTAMDAFSIHYATSSRMPPSKSGPIQRAGNELIFPRALDVTDPDGALENIANFMVDYPIPKALHAVTPLVRSRRAGAQRQIKRNKFITDFRRACRLADMQCKQWGTHAFRAGGMNAL